jgi:hypothetical protein
MQQETEPCRCRKVSKPMIAVIALVIVAAALLVVMLGIQTWKTTKMPQVSFNASKYYGVFLTNGQVYFGHLNKVQSGYLALADIYYLQVKQNLQQPTDTTKTDTTKTDTTTTTDQTQQQLSLVKLGDELHGPEDSMVINQDQVLFFEPLKDDGQVVKAIKEHQTKK